MSKIDTQRFEGSLLSLALGDAYGAPYEGGVLERLLWKLLGKQEGKHRWTDDTQMTLDVAESLIEYGGINQDDLARRFASSYSWTRGYGPGAARTLRSIRHGADWRTASRLKYPQGSMGNGGAMRAGVIGLFFANEPDQKILDAAYQSAVVTHAHPLGQAGAGLIALCSARVYKQDPPQHVMEALIASQPCEPFITQLHTISKWLNQQDIVSSITVARELGHGIQATQSCVTAIYCALAHLDQPFEKLLAYCIGLGGDTDTIAAMAGGIWGTANGAENLPVNLLAKLEQSDRIRERAFQLAARMKQNPV